MRGLVWEKTGLSLLTRELRSNCEGEETMRYQATRVVRDLGFRPKMVS